MKMLDSLEIICATNSMVSSIISKSNRVELLAHRAYESSVLITDHLTAINTKTSLLFDLTKDKVYHLLEMVDK